MRQFGNGSLTKGRNHVAPHHGCPGQARAWHWVYGCSFRHGIRLL